MSLPWFPFNIKDFLANTKRLNTEAKGAYLLLMLDYYEQGRPPPDDDDVLAAICELSPDVWVRHRKVLAPLFRIEGDFWHHDRIEREMLEASSKHSLAVAKAQKAAAASAATRSARSSASSLPQAQNRPNPASSEAPSSLQADPKQDLGRTHKHKHKHTPSGEEGPPPPKAAPQGLGSQIDPGFQPNDEAIQRAHDQGATDADIDSEVRKFIAHHTIKENLSPSWDASWAKWWEGWKPHRDKQAVRAAGLERAAPRIEVNSAPDWDGYCKRFAGGMGWPRGIGPDPESDACRAPQAILIKHGLRKESAA